MVKSFVMPRNLDENYYDHDYENDYVTKMELSFL